jgi:hypothetical protein
MTRTIDIAAEVPRALKILGECQRVPELAHRANDMLFRLHPLFQHVTAQMAGNGCSREDLEPIALLLPMINDMGELLYDRQHGEVSVPTH